MSIDLDILNNMNLQILKVAQYLPYEIIDKILSYDKRIKYKKGKFINQIYPNDERYDLLHLLTFKTPTHFQYNLKLFDLKSTIIYIYK